MEFDKNKFKKQIQIKDKTYSYYSLSEFQKENNTNLDNIPFSIKILFEQALRNYDNFKVIEEDLYNLADWNSEKLSDKEIPFFPTRVILQDFTGVPSLVDLASLREKLNEAGKNPALINPVVDVDLIIDHSVQIDEFGHKQALDNNIEIEFERNIERYKFIKWGQKAFSNFRVFPPGAGIIHQVNLEYLAQVILEREDVLFPDTVVGTDSHTTMINGIGVLGWGVGGIEAESAMLGQPIYMKIPEVIGVKLYNSLSEGVTATDLVLTITEQLRNMGVVEKFVEFYGNGLENLSLPDRATIANMAPEYGATMGYFPVDDVTLQYMRNTGRSEQTIANVEQLCKAQKIFRTSETQDPIYTQVLEFDLQQVQPSLAGPKRPQDRIDLASIKEEWNKSLVAPVNKRGFALDQKDLSAQTQLDESQTLKHGSIVIAAITSCTNTSNPSVLINAGLVAKKAYEKGLSAKPWVKTSLAPGSRVVTDYLDATGLMDYFEKMGFYTAGYGCTTCIGNSGPLDDKIVQAIHKSQLVVASILSGNRNFEGRVHGDVKANFLASPPLVVAFAIAGTMNIDIFNEALGKDQQGNDVFLKDIWPSQSEINTALNAITPEMYCNRYSQIQNISQQWNDLEVPEDIIYQWDDQSTYIQNPSFFDHVSTDKSTLPTIENARILCKLGDSITTDHISPAGLFKEDTPAGQYLLSRGIPSLNFNTYGSRRGNDRIMVRGTLANVRIKNQLAPESEGGFTKYFPTDETMSIFDAAKKYRENQTPLIILAGKEYGTGSSRDWAAKGVYLLGVKAVIVESYERIHRSNLIGMGVLPLQFLDGDSHQSLGLNGDEHFTIEGLTEKMKPKSKIVVKANNITFNVISRLDTEVEIEYYKNGGILHTVLKNMLT